MSGQPNIYPTDASKFRQNYLANLELMAKLDDYNLQANKIYKKTGQTPTQMIDSRTTAEKLADIERLKVEVRGILSEIADGLNASAIVEGLDPQQLVFLAQHIEEIVRDVKPKYRYGIPADIFIPYLISYMRRANETNEVNFGLQQAAGQNILLSLEQILNGVVTKENLNLLKQTVNNATLQGGTRKSVLDSISKVEEIIPSRETLLKINNIKDADKLRIKQIELNDVFRLLPTNTQVINIQKDLERAKNDRQQSTNIAREIINLLELQPALQQQMNQVMQELRTPPKLNPTSTKERRAGGASAESDSDNEEDSVQGLKNYIIEMTKNLFPYSRERYPHNAWLKDQNGFENKTISQITSLKNLQHLKSILQSKNPSPNKTKGRGIIVGSGVAKSSNRLNVANLTDYSKGITPSQKYVPFGKFFIDHQRLGDNIVSLKRGNGVNVSGIPVARIGKEVGDVLRCIVGGGQPQFHQLEKLSPDEKLYLHKIAKTSKILDRISIPSPNKNDDEQDINQFEIYKGELLNGNDSQEVIKKFKILIMKMVKKDLLPKGQAKDILMDLVSLGY